MSFQFNFFNAQAVDPKVDSSVDEGYADSKNKSIFELEVTAEMMKITENENFESEIIDEEAFPGLKKRKYSSIVTDLKERQSISGQELVSITVESDVVPHQYEGGLKTWECSIDLLHFLKDESTSLNRVSNVLEVGCGSGLPGIYCHELVETPKLFVFQDFNQGVLESVTLPNVLLNISKFSLDKFKFYYGDWKGFSSKLPKHSFDLVLTSETIYRFESYSILLDLFDHVLEPVNGRVLLAAKDYYFGLGGSVQQFSKLAISLGWKVKVLRKFSEGVPRSILELCH